MSAIVMITISTGYFTILIIQTELNVLITIAYSFGACMWFYSQMCVGTVHVRYNFKGAVSWVSVT